uniref:E3 ubiquitin-protein ligase TRIM62-like n=1 Tax=Myxine glutinosa TaxID=7769 RepID=UPI00358FB7E3
MSGDVSVKIDEDLKCPVCLDVFTDPVRLACDHCFCLTCLQQLWHGPTTDESQNRSCPECKRNYQVSPAWRRDPDLQARAVRVWSLLETASQSQRTSACDHCLDHSAAAVKTCLTCDATLCAEHVRPHLNRPAFRAHTLADLLSGGEDGELRKCGRHNELLKLYCQNDRVCVCSLCVVIGEHKNHSVITAEEAYEHLQENWAEAQIKVKFQGKEAEEAVNDLLRMQNIAVTTSHRGSPHRSGTGCCTDREATFQWIQELLLRDTCLTPYSGLDVDSEDVLLESPKVRPEADVMTSFDESMLHSRVFAARYSGVSLVGIEHENNLVIFSEHLQLAVAADHHGGVLLVATSPGGGLTLICQYMAALPHLERRVLSVSKLMEHTPVGLDPHTAHPCLEISADLQSVSWSRRSVHGPSESADRYDTRYNVLGQQLFTAGTHYWEVAVGSKSYWVVGLATRSAPRKGGLDPEATDLGMNKESWALFHCGDIYTACHDRQSVPVTIQAPLRKLGILLDYFAGQIQFYDADRKAILHTFCGTFSQALSPALNPCANRDDTNEDPLVLVHLVKEGR